MIGYLPVTLEVAGTDHPIRTDFRDVLNVMAAFADPNLSAEEKVFVCLLTIYEDFSDLDIADYKEAYDQAVKFIDAGAEPKDGKSPRVMDWEQDERLIFPAVNKVAGFETRAVEYLHWWTFLGYFMEITEGTYSQILSMRSKKSRGKKLEKYEQEFWNNNRSLCVIKTRLSDEEQAERDELEKLIG